MAKEILYAIEQMGKEKGIEAGKLIEMVKAAILSAAQKALSSSEVLEVNIDPKNFDVKIFAIKTVVDNIENPDLEIKFSDALQINPDIRLNEELHIKKDIANFGRIAAQAAKQVILQKVLEEEREMVFNEFEARKLEIIHCNVRRIERNGNVIVDLNKTEGILPKKEQIPGDNYHIGERFRSIILEVIKTSRGPEIILSRANSAFMEKLFEIEVPEIEEDAVEIVNSVREPGIRAKISVKSVVPHVDAVGSCVGVKGSRVNSVMKELRGERIDIIEWSSNATTYIKNSLKPAKINEVVYNKKERCYELSVDEDQLSLAIGRKGQNVRLASKLTGYEINIKGAGSLEEINDSN